MIEYEVTIHVDAELADDYLAWLQGHVTQMLALPGFREATILGIQEPPHDGRIGYCARYRLSDAEALQAYLEQHAPRMRADGVRRFGDRFTVGRRVLAPLRCSGSTGS